MGDPSIGGRGPEEEPEEEPDEEPLLPAEVAVPQIGRQIAEAESARNHVEHDKLGEHLDVLIDSLSKLSGCSP